VSSKKTYGGSRFSSPVKILTPNGQKYDTPKPNNRLSLDPYSIQYYTAKKIPSHEGVHLSL
jgi:hypothetical protein